MYAKRVLQCRLYDTQPGKSRSGNDCSKVMSRPARMDQKMWCFERYQAFGKKCVFVYFQKDAKGGREKDEKLLRGKGKGEVGVSAQLNGRSEVMNNKKIFIIYDNRIVNFKVHLRILPSLVMNPIVHRALLIFLVGVLGI